jgi:hypothetical protein
VREQLGDISMVCMRRPQVAGKRADNRHYGRDVNAREWQRKLKTRTWPERFRGRRAG